MRKFLLFLCLIITVGSLWAQKNVTGTVLDANGEPLISASVVCEGTTVGTTTDLDGKFQLKLPEGCEKLKINFLGYVAQTIDVKSIDGELKIKLNEEMELLNTIVVSASKKQERLLDAPASITTISSQSIENTAAMTSTDHLKKVPGVDVMQTGLVSANVNIRGFNNIFSGAMLSMVDYRIARVPSLRVNTYQMIPSNDLDIESIEILRGPASAMYGPNASDGVMHIITRSPLDLGDKKYETTVSLMGGFRGRNDLEVQKAKGPTENDIPRNMFRTSFRHAQKLSDKLGFKISGNYTQGHDWPFYDPREPAVGDSLIFGSVQNGGLFEEDTTRAAKLFDRDFFIQNFQFDGRLDYAINKDIDLTFSGGISRASNIELTGLGAGQAINWIYSYGQFRARWKNLYVQYFMNSSNAGDTYLIPQVGPGGPHNVQSLADRSKLHVATIQHSVNPLDNLNLIYGFDYLATRPNSDNTIYGRYDDSAAINQIGTYIQAEYDIIPKLTIMTALRFDYQDVISEPQFSPRVALLYKPKNNHTLRATFNRAFNSPTALNYYLDLANGQIPNGINIRGIGNPNGWNYRRDDNGIPQFRSPTDGIWYNYADPTNNGEVMRNMTNEFSKIFAQGLPGYQQNPIGAQFQASVLIDSLFMGIETEGGTIETNGVNKLVVDYVNLLNTGDLNSSITDISRYQDYEAIKSTINQTYEIGYKGILFDKLFVNLDFWYSQVKNFTSPLVNVSGSVMFNPSELIGALGGPTAGPLFDNIQSLSPGARQAVLALDGNPAYTDPSGTIPSIPGTVWDELAVIISGANQQLTLGTVTPDNELVNSDVILTYFNVGQLDVAGFDFGFKYLVTDEFSVTGALSHINKDSIQISAESDFYIYMNTPKWRSALSLEYQNKKHGFGASLGWRWNDGFPAQSAVYSGYVLAANFLDLGFSYRPKAFDRIKIGVDVQNLLDYEYSNFPGTPEMGITVFGKLQYTISK